MKKYSNARSPQISICEREYENFEVPVWLRHFADTLDQSGKPKSAVEVARERTESIADQINSIMGNTSKFSTVEDAVIHYQEKTGLKDYLKRLEAKNNLSKKASTTILTDPLKAGLEMGLEDVEKNQWGDVQAAFNAHLMWLEDEGNDTSKYWQEGHKHSEQYGKDFELYKTGYYKAMEVSGGVDAYIEKLKEHMKSDQYPYPYYTEKDYDGLKREFSKKASSNLMYDAGFICALNDIKNKMKLDPKTSFETWSQTNQVAMSEETYDNWKNGYNKACAFFKLIKDQFGHERTDDEIIRSLKGMLGENKLQSAASNKSAQLEVSETKVVEPKLLQKFPEIKYFIDNMVKTRHGNVHIPAIQQDLAAVYKNQGVTEEDVNDPELIKYINDIIAGEQEMHVEQVEHRVGEGVGVQDLHETDDYFSFQSGMKG